MLHLAGVLGEKVVHLVARRRRDKGCQLEEEEAEEERG